MATPKRPLVLVVEDDEDLRLAVLGALDVLGFDGRGFADASSVLAGHPAPAAYCLIVDIGLPGISGFELYRQLCARGDAAPVVFITGRDDAARRASAQALGSQYLCKPFSATALHDAMQRAHGTGAARP